MNTATSPGQGFLSRDAFAARALWKRPRLAAVWTLLGMCVTTVLVILLVDDLAIGVPLTGVAWTGTATLFYTRTIRSERKTRRAVRRAALATARQVRSPLGLPAWAVNDEHNFPAARVALTSLALGPEQEEIALALADDFKGNVADLAEAAGLLAETGTGGVRR